MCQLALSTPGSLVPSAAEAANASRLGRFSAGLDVGSAGLFWLRGVGLCKHAKLAASSKRIGESGESS